MQNVCHIHVLSSFNNEFRPGSLSLQQEVAIEAIIMRRIPALLLVLAAMFFGCNRMFEYSPYDANVPTDITDTHRKQHKSLMEQELENENRPSFRFALLADNHIYFDELMQAVELINQDTNVHFVLHAGDMADGGYLAEYALFHTIMGRLNKPYFTVIGNHDVLANGRDIYNQMFGPENYSFTYLDHKFIFFNNIVLELHPEEPDFVWLEEELHDGLEHEKQFVIAHLPPWHEDLTHEITGQYKDAMVRYGVSLSMHGHDHYPNQASIEGVDYLVSGAPQMGVFRIIDVHPDGIEITTVNL